MDDNKEALEYALETLKHYADTSNWGMVSIFGHKKANRWIGEGEGIELAEEALRKISLIVSEES